DLSGLDAAYRSLDQLLNLGEVEPVPGDGFAVRAHDDLRRAGYLTRLHVGRSFDGADGVGDLVALFLEQIEVGPEELDGELRLGAADEFVHAELDGLGDVRQNAGHALQLF